MLPKSYSKPDENFENQNLAQTSDMKRTRPNQHRDRHKMTKTMKKHKNRSLRLLEELLEPRKT